MVFFQADHGMTGFRGLLPSLDGERVKAALNALISAKRRSDEADAGNSTSSNPAPVYDQALADAFVVSVTKCLPSSSQATEKPWPKVESAGSGRTAVVVVVSEQRSRRSADEGPGSNHAGHESLGPPKLRQQRSNDPKEWVVEIVGGVPIPLSELEVLAGNAIGPNPTVDIYAAVQRCDGSLMKFGRSRRLASSLQRLALAARDRGCVVEGCTVGWQFCDADHIVEWESGGTTDLTNLRLLCAAHHTLRHEPGRTLRFRSHPDRSRPSKEHGKRAA